MICNGSSCRYSMARMACSVPLRPRQCRPGHKPCLPRIKRRAVSMSMVSIITFDLLLLHACQPSANVGFMLFMKMGKECSSSKGLTFQPREATLICQYFFWYALNRGEKLSEDLIGFVQDLTDRVVLVGAIDPIVD